MKNFDWAESTACGITVCDANGMITYMNAAACEMKHGDFTGKNVMDCHNEHSREIIQQMLKDGGTNAYTIEKNGQKR